MQLYSIVQGVPNQHGILSSYSIVAIFIDYDKAHELFNQMKKQQGMELYRDGYLMHKPTGVAFCIMYHTAI